MKVLVTGGAGLIGANFVLRTRATRPDWQITVLDALTYAGSRENLAPVADQIEFVHGNVADPDLVDRLVADADAVVHFAAESHNDNSLDDPWPFMESNIIGTYRLLEAVRRAPRAAPPHLDRRGLRRPRARRPEPLSPSRPPSTPRARTQPARPAPTCWSGRGSAPSASRPRCPTAPTTTAPYQHVEKFIPRQITGILQGVKPKLYGAGANVRDWIHVDDHNDAVVTILEKGRLGETYLIGADGEQNNRQIVALLLELMGKPADWFDLVPDRPGHDMRYAIDSSKLRAETGWAPKYQDIRAGLTQTIEWYRANEAWWTRDKERTEQAYQRLGR